MRCSATIVAGPAVPDDDRRHHPEPSGPTPWRGTDEGTVFHYDRAEREAGRSHAWEPPRGGFFRRNKGLTLTIIDVAIVLLLFAIVTFVIGPLRSRGRIDPYRLAAEAVVFDGQVLIAVTVTDPDAGHHEVPPADSVVTISVADQEAADLVPTVSPTRTVRLRAALEDIRPAIRDDEVVITVRIGDEEDTLRAKPEGEALPAP